ncbi:hypothetical protein [Wolbachia endosymbiont of Ctenocephalides felis wCfeJ]|uniref:hypothetical protein n=1 Tax=Wolbachia endosymbiont of Ctenocephalides felis wCfeJ TaxID=2732594 RepID=UPI00144855F2|nr:hypothetical protein [Wolbachia endosymbiont of Ctenocephalides felis wCfeJ]WCR57890.1 MAG: hypothetical protein PG980_000362 [Wolbachia endosymbiont of Ctenocephalides felis wCfeJ]
MANKREYTEEFKLEVIKLFKETGQTSSKNNGCSRSQLTDADSEFCLIKYYDITLHTIPKELI